MDDCGLVRRSCLDLWLRRHGLESKRERRAELPGQVVRSDVGAVSTRSSAVTSRSIDWRSTSRQMDASFTIDPPPPSAALPAFIVTALVSGKPGVRGLARRSLPWRVPLRWYLISLLAPLLIFLIAVTILYGFAPLRALAQNWLLLFTAFLPALAIMILLNNVAEEIGWTGFVFARFQDRLGPLGVPC